MLSSNCISEIPEVSLIKKDYICPTLLHLRNSLTVPTAIVIQNNACNR